MIGWTEGIVVYILLWWMVLFAVLPIGVVSQADEGERIQGTDPSAPVNPRIWFKIKLTTLVTALVWLVVVAIIHFDPFGLELREPLIR